MEKVSLTAVKEMGFSDRLVTLLLPEPELVNNPYYKKAAKMKLWHLEDVQKAMESKNIKKKEQKEKSLQRKL